MSFPLSQIQLRYQMLVGQPSGVIDAFGTSNINAAIRDILNKYRFSWNQKEATLSVVTGVATLPTDYNPQWHLEAAFQADDPTNLIPLTEIQKTDINLYNSTDPVYFIEYDTTTDTYIFNTLLYDCDVTIYYNFIPTDLSGATDKCFIPDLEAVSYLAASKKWVGAERDTELKQVYQQEAERLITAMYIHDIASQDMPNVYSITSMQSW